MQCLLINLEYDGTWVVLMVDKPKIFVTFHTDDFEYKVRFDEICKDIAITRSIKEGEIPDGKVTETTIQYIRDNYIKDTSVTIVLIGKSTWQRKYIDWEIYSSLIRSAHSTSSGLFGITLPSYPHNYGKYYLNTIPPRLFDNTNKGDNTKFGYADVHEWSEDPHTIKCWIEQALSKRSIVSIDQSRKLQEKNLTGITW